jgi:hypothetical protein
MSYILGLISSLCEQVLKGKAPLSIFVEKALFDNSNKAFSTKILRG